MYRFGWNRTGENYTIFQAEIPHLLLQALLFRPPSNNKQANRRLKQGEEKEGINGAVHSFLRSQSADRDQHNVLHTKAIFASNSVSCLFREAQTEPAEFYAAWQYLDRFGYSIALKHRFMGG